MMLKACVKLLTLVLVFTLGLVIVTQRVSAIAQLSQATDTDETKSTDTSKNLPEGCYYQEIQCFAEPCEPLVVCNDNAKDTTKATPPPPEGCRYEQVQCFQAPCPPVLVCASPTLTTNSSPAASPSSSPSSDSTDTNDQGPYCYYKQVQCLAAPCEPQWVCEDTPPAGGIPQNSCPGSPDQNGDNLINLFDYTAFINVLKGTITTSKAKADLNCDGRVNILDYTLFINAFQNGGKS